MLKPTELERLIRHIVKNNQYLENTGKRKKNTLGIESHAGIGKTSIVEQVARAEGMDFVKINLAQTEEVGDLIGFPIREFECKAKGSATVWFNERQIEHMRDLEYTGKTRTSYCPPAWVPTEETNKGGILLLDDWTRADQRIIQAAMEICDRQEFLSWKLPKNWHVILTSNPDNGSYFVTAMDDAQKTRYISCQLKFDVKQWAEWAESAGVDTRCINFLLLNPEMVKEEAGVNARIATDFFASISSLQSFEGNMDIIQLLGEGSVGEEFTNAFGIFISNKQDKLPSPEFMLNDDDEKKVIKEIKKVCGKVDSKDYAMSVASVLSTRLLNYIKNEAKVGKIDNDHVCERMKDILVAEVFPKDIRYNMIKSINASSARFHKLRSYPEIIKDLTK